MGRSDHRSTNRRPRRRSRIAAIALILLTAGVSCSESSTKPTSQSSVVVEPRPGIWGEHLIVDIHAHIGTFRGFDLSMPTLLDNLERYGLQLALISNIDGANLPGTTANLDEVESNQATADSVLKYPHLFRGLLWTRPNQRVPIADLERFLTDPAYEQVFVGMKFHPVMNQFPADSENVDPYLELCAKHDLAAVFHSDPSGDASAVRIYAAARRHPGVPIVLYHMGFFGPHRGAIDVVAESVKNGDAELYLGTAQADPTGVLAAVAELGSERVLFGSDAAFFGAAHYEEYEAMMDSLSARLTPDEFRNVVRDNAIRVFKLDSL